ncbi:MAG: glycosyltransferase [Pseudomonadota bacterium]
MAEVSRPHFIYVLVADETNYFAEMAAVSLATLRATNKNARVTVLLDETTAALETPAMAYVRDAADVMQVEECPYDTPLLISRYLKLSSRRLVQGDFVYMDLDTLIARDLSKLQAHKGVFAAAVDRIGPTDRMRAIAARKGWALPSHYFNAGVFCVRDTPATQKAFKDAYSLWRELNAEGFGWDQLPFNVAFHRSADVDVHPMSQSFNAQILIKTYPAIRPHIYHIFAAHFEERNESILHILAKKLKATGVLDEGMIADFVRTGNPWTKLSRPGQYIALARPVSAVKATLKLLTGGLKKEAS